MDSNPVTPNLPTSNNNPGDLRLDGQVNASAGAGGFADFPTPQDGFGGLLNDIQAKINKKPQDTLADFANTYAPEEDGNNSAQYAANLANQLGVAPNATIGSLEPQIGQFADAVAKNEGYQGQNQGQSTLGAVGSTANAASNAVGGPVAATGLGVIGGGLAALGGDVLGAGEVGLGDIEGLAGSLLGKATGNGNSGGSTAPTYQPSTDPSSMYSSLQGLLGSTTGGQQVIKEGQNRGIDPLTVLEQSGAAAQLQPDENGNLDKVAPTNFLNNLISQDKTTQQQGVMTMTSPTHLDDMQTAAEAHIDAAMADTGERTRAKKEVQRIFDDYRAEQPTKKDKNGKSYVSQFVSPARLQKKKELLSVSEKDFAKPQHERAAATHVKEAMRRRLSAIAKQDHVEGWDETNKRMEAHILAKKAIAKMPKKAPRDKKKELKKEVVSALAGAGIGKLLGNGLIGGLIGDVLNRRLSKKEYGRVGSKKDREEASQRANTPQRGLIRKN